MFRPVTKLSYNKKDRIEIILQNIITITTKPQRIAQNQNIPQPTSNTVNFHDQPRSSQELSTIYPFFQQNKNNQNNIILKINLIIMHKIIFHQMMKNTITKINNDFTPTRDLVLTALSKKTFLNHTHTRNEERRQPRNNPTSHNNNFQQQNPVNTQSYQPTQMQNEVQLPY